MQYIELISTILDSTVAILTNQSTAPISISQRKLTLDAYVRKCCISVVLFCFVFSLKYHGTKTKWYDVYFVRCRRWT